MVVAARLLRPGAPVRRGGLSVSAGARGNGCLRWGEGRTHLQIFRLPIAHVIFAKGCDATGYTLESRAELAGLRWRWAKLRGRRAFVHLFVRPRSHNAANSHHDTAAMLTLRSLCLFASMAALCGGCASHWYQAPTESTTRIQFTPSNTYAYIDVGNSCGTRKQVRSVTADSLSNVPIPSGERVRIDHGTLVYGGTCTAVASFIPQSDTTYVSEFTTNYSTCRLTLYRIGASGMRELEPTARSEPPLGCIF